LYLLCSTSTLCAASLIAAHTTNGEEENHFYELNLTLNAERIRGFYLRYLWMKTFVFLLTLDHESTDRCFLYACYGNPFVSAQSMPTRAA
jgi:hypothetical protein